MPLSLPAPSSPASPTPRVVVLSKRHRLTSYLIQELARDGMLAAVVYEHRFGTLRDRLRYLRRNARREGRVHTLDVLAYESYDRLFRRNEFARAADALLPLDLPEPSLVSGALEHHVTNLNAPASRALLAGLAPDLLVSHACGILESHTVGLARVAAVNIHCGVLPQYRGHASTFWAMYRRDVGNIGVTVHLLAQVVDTGLPVGIARVAMGPADDDITMWFRAFREGVRIVKELAAAVRAGGGVQTLPYAGQPGPHYHRRGLTEHLRFRTKVLPALRGRVSTAGPPSHR
jgi:formyl transferase-like protein